MLAVGAGGHVAESQRIGQVLRGPGELAGQEVGQAAFFGFDDGAGVVGDQAAQHLKSVRRSAVIVLAEVELTDGPADDLVPVSGHPEFQSGVTGIVLRGRPHPGPVRAAVSADAD